ncbi:hypothetical protein GDO81_022224 [Engystomops pustulosus]|uniref:Uncharacterized protein n=1 Tax=Engystomops pustulosus TaxID=76066 RepID=A0AAV6ZJF4_ENGPU|nr:hypothetical protein GDO81_022224 [Engystomops pustulosus]
MTESDAWTLVNVSQCSIVTDIWSGGGRSGVSLSAGVTIYGVWCHFSFSMVLFLMYRYQTSSLYTFSCSVSIGMWWMSARCLFHCSHLVRSKKFLFRSSMCPLPPVMCPLPPQ